MLGRIIQIIYTYIMCVLGKTYQKVIVCVRGNLSLKHRHKSARVVMPTAVHYDRSIPVCVWLYHNARVVDNNP